MPYEIGGRADKYGNRFEIRVIIYHMLELLEEKIDYIILEAVGDEEQGVDLWIGHKDASQESIQCKVRNASKEYWDFGTANARGIFSNWKFQLDRGPNIYVSLVSPLAFTFLEDLINRAINSNNNGRDFYDYQIKPSDGKFLSFTNNICRVMGIDHKLDYDLNRLIGYLKRIRYKQFPDYCLREIIMRKIENIFLSKPNKVYDSIVSWIIDGDILGKKINLSMIHQFLNEKQNQIKKSSL